MGRELNYQTFAELDLLCFDVEQERRRRRRDGDRGDDRGQGKGKGHGVRVGPERVPPHAGARHQVPLPLVDAHGRGPNAAAADGTRGRRHVAARRAGCRRRQRLQATAGTRSKKKSMSAHRRSVLRRNQARARAAEGTVITPAEETGRIKMAGGERHGRQGRRTDWLAG